MSYDLDNWDTKELKDFVLPVDILDTAADWPRMQWPPSEIKPEQPLTITGHDYVENFYLKGVLKEDGFYVEEFWAQSMGASDFYSDELLPLLKQSRGYMKALLVWESGDTVQYLYVKDGVVTTEKL